MFLWRYDVILPTVTVKAAGSFPPSKQWAAVTIQYGVRMEPPHETGPWCSSKSTNTCHGQDPGCAFVPPTILGRAFLVPNSTFPSDEINKSNVVYNGNWTEWSAIWSEIIRVISKLNERAARVQFEITSMISDHNCTTRSSIATLFDPFWNRTI